MSCRNCEYNITEVAQFCQSCGAKVIRDRITVKGLKNDFFNHFLGLDNIFFRTIKMMFIAPDTVSDEYISGTRKMFIQPFAFLAISMTIATIIYNSFSNQYAEMNSSMQSESFYKKTFDMTQKGKPEAYYDSLEYDLEFKKYRDGQLKMSKNIQNWILKYFNIFVVLCLPFYTFIAYLVFGKKRFNYGEHLVINSYLLGFGMMLVAILFLLGIFLHPALYYLGGFVVMFYYTLVYSRLCEISWGKSIVKFLKFIGILVLTIVIITILALIGGFIKGYMSAALST